MGAGVATDLRVRAEPVLREARQEPDAVAVRALEEPLCRVVGGDARVGPRERLLGCGPAVLGGRVGARREVGLQDAGRREPVLHERRQSPGGDVFLGAQFLVEVALGSRELDPDD